jgi:hypothetical protein
MPSLGYAITAVRSGRTALPVSPASYIYSHFEHVSGVPAPEGTPGVAITKLKILDVLIDQLSQIKKQPAADISGVSPPDDRLDALISRYEGQIKAARTANSAMPYIPAPPVPSGLLFSMTL